MNANRNLNQNYSNYLHDNSKLKGSQKNFENDVNNGNLIDEALEEEKIKKIAKGEFDNLIVPYQEELRSNISKQRNFVEREDFENGLNNIDKELNSMNDYMKNMQNNFDKNLKSKNDQFVTRSEHEEAIRNLMDKILNWKKVLMIMGKI